MTPSETHQAAASAYHAPLSTSLRPAVPACGSPAMRCISVATMPRLSMSSGENVRLEVPRSRPLT